MGNGDTEDPRYGCGAWRSGVSSASFVLVDNSDSIEENDVLRHPTLSRTRSELISAWHRPPTTSVAACLVRPTRMQWLVLADTDPLLFASLHPIRACKSRSA